MSHLFLQVPKVIVISFLNEINVIWLLVHLCEQKNRKEFLYCEIKLDHEPLWALNSRYETLPYDILCSTSL